MAVIGEKYPWQYQIGARNNDIERAVALLKEQIKSEGFAIFECNSLLRVTDYGEIKRLDILFNPRSGQYARCDHVLTGSSYYLPSSCEGANS